ncbi:MAG: DNA gyrase/topoisomerase IV subunit A [Bacteroidaceae bacterium]|jgi:topoisomerase-4 subunit A|nr:DNA gyrase/topoisomerase IV subunit A [Bacteroidaceae bacterium]MBP8602975.1 DNA gyrase/topoisomerase IV subunit A [Bacteroidaceae bacterium]HBA12482.1 DNA gyrase/topoisomerase IV subunit A [Bacteroidales bacterium]HOD67982.1 DNA gyrase/topoisomerase IV subunit A [Bacteroidaceae bacterium]HQL25511.1 DNA gyrase/topoisomerase IV subunit A [Bacteroidaceae bacterium]
MSEEYDNIDEIVQDNQERDNGLPTQHSTYTPVKDNLGVIRHQLSGMYQSWFLDYASYTILERAVPHLADGLKPVQRRILHSMKRLDDGRFNKVANIVGHTMQFHPHGDASIGDALVQLGQKNLLIECQGNWGNILTGHKAAAPRYIEARLSKFALETLFNPKTTEWKSSYDGRNREPVTLPVKFPLLIAQGAEGIAVGLSCKILPHNFNELCDAAVSYLKNEEFHLYPDFETGGMIDVSRYNDGERGGAVRVRARITKEADNRTLVITEIPYGENVMTLCDSIVKAGEKGKIKIRKVENLTADKVEIRISLAPGVSSDKTISALYAFTSCEVSISPNCCVIDDNKPHFLRVSDVLKRSADNTMELLRLELEIEKNELLEQLHFASLEEIFIEERIYKDIEFEQAANIDAACEHIDNRLTPFYPQMIREVTKEDILKLMEIKMARILKFNKTKAEEAMARMKSEIARINKDLSDMVRVTIKWFLTLKEKYGAEYPRRTEIRSFDTIEATKVIEANLKLFINRADGFIGTDLKKDEFVCNCSEIDDVIIFYKDGMYKVIKVAEKVFVGQNVLYLNVFKRNDKRTIYNVVYRDGKRGAYYIKRFAATGLTRDKEYNLTQGKDGSRVVYFSANHNGEAEIIKVTLKPNPKLRKPVFDKDFSEILIKGRQAKGNLLTRNEVHRIGLKSHGVSTLGGRKVWFDKDVTRLNLDGHGRFLGEFDNDDLLLVMMTNGEYYTTEIDSNCHFDAGIIRLEKFDHGKVWTAVLFDASQKGYLYLKRFSLDPTSKRLNFLGDNDENRLLLLTDTFYPRILVTLGGDDSFREPIEVDAEQFVGVKSVRARGRRVTTFNVDKVEELEPLRLPPEKKEEKKSVSVVNLDDDDNDNGFDSDNEKENSDDGQLSLF